MIDLGWTAPERRVDAGTALRGILWQHRNIRTLLGEMRAVAEIALDGKPRSPTAVASAIGAVRSIMEVHLAFEEAVLVPILRDDLPLGPERAARLLDEHARQRTTLATLHGEATASPKLEMLPAKLAFLADWLLADMAEEEKSLLVPDVVRDHAAVAAQSCG
jgi:hypothetical protein